MIYNVCPIALSDAIQRHIHSLMYSYTVDEIDKTYEPSHALSVNINKRNKRDG